MVRELKLPSEKRLTNVTVNFPNAEEIETRVQKIKRVCFIHSKDSYLYRFIKIQQTDSYNG